MIDRIVYTARLVWVFAIWTWRVSGSPSQSDLMYTCFKDRYDIPKLTIIIGQGREAWRVSNFAVDALKRWGI